MDASSRIFLRDKAIYCSQRKASPFVARPTSWLRAVPLRATFSIRENPSASSVRAFTSSPPFERYRSSAFSCSSSLKELQTEQLDLLMLSKEQSYALLLSTLAGLSTSIGGAAAIIQRPGDGQLALLLGLAIGVMATLSIMELWIKNALEHGAWAISAAVFGGALLYYLVQPYLPDFEPHHLAEASSERQAVRKDLSSLKHLEDGSPRALEGHQGSQAKHRRAAEGLRSRAPHADQHSQTSSSLLGQEAASSKEEFSASAAEAALQTPTSRAAAARSAELLRLGLLMALTMTLHNMPEGFAVAFASFTDFGPVMAVAIAVHNIPEGIIVAAPVYAATGSRWKALGISVASGLSEPIGALIALLLVRPDESSTMLNQYMLAFVGGIMTGVCYLELWPEAKKCHDDRRLWQGIALGSVVMGSTLIFGV